MSLFSRLDRAVARFNRRFGGIAAATDAEGAGMGARTNAVGVRVVAEEIENASSSDERDAQDDEPTHGSGA